MTNFDFLLADDRLINVYEAAAAGENVIQIDPESCVLNCRRAMEFAIKLMYAWDRELEVPDNANLQNLLYDKNFREIVGPELWNNMDYIRRSGNSAAHEDVALTYEQAAICLEFLHSFLDFFAYCYGKSYQKQHFDRNLLKLTKEEAMEFVKRNNK